MINGRLSRRATLGGMLGASALSLKSARAWAQAGPVRIGVLQTISGPLAPVGNAHVLGAQIAATQVNQSGGIDGRQVELIVRDVRINANEMVAAMRELAGQGVTLIMGDAFTGPDLAAAPIAPSLNVVFVVATIPAMELSHELYNRNVFHAGQNGYMQFFAQGKIMADHYPDLKRWGCFLADAAGFRNAWDYLSFGLKKAYAQKGKTIEIVDPVLAKVGATDYRNQAAELASLKLDGMVLADTGSEALTFLKQSQAYGYLPKLGAVADMALSTKIGPALKKETPANFWTCCTWVIDAYKQYPMAVEFNKMAVAETKDTIIDPFIAQGHLGITTIAAGARAAKSIMPEAVIPAMEAMSYDTIYGPMKFRAEDHQLHFNPGFIRVGPDESEAGWKIYEFVQIDWKDAIEPPSPGKKFELG